MTELEPTLDRGRYIRRAGIAAFCALLLGVCIAVHIYAYVQLFPGGQVSAMLAQFFLVMVDIGLWFLAAEMIEDHW
jgi:hypothetical protein